jgi:hypothetical protein
MKRSRVFSLLVLSAVCYVPTAGAYSTDFQPLSTYPAVTGPAVAAVLGDGRFILYDGDAVYIETDADSGAFTQVATGYLGDPAFIAVTPDGRRCLLGAGEVDWTGDPNNDWVWLFDADAPQNAPPVDGFGNVSDGLALVTTNYWAAWLNDDLVLIENAPGWVSQWVILDVNTGTYQKVLNKGGSSATLVLGCWLTHGYVFGTIGFGDGMGTTRTFAIQDLIDVFEEPAYDPVTSPLDWASGILVGENPSFSSGPSTTTDAGVLVFGGYNSEILYVDPSTGQPVESPVTIGGVPGRTVRPYYNPVTRKTLVTMVDWGSAPDWSATYSAYISTSDFKELPAMDFFGIAVLALVLMWTSVWALRQRTAHLS